MPDTPTRPPASSAPSARTTQSGVREALLAFVFVTAVISALYRLRGHPLVEQHLAVLAAVLFLYVPAALIWRSRGELEQFGLRARPLRSGLLHFLAAVVLVLPLFALLYRAFVTTGCPLLSSKLPSLACPIPLLPKLRLPPAFQMAIASQILVVAVPEEFFFRGYLQERLLAHLGPLRAVVWTALLFAIGHYLVTFSPAALAVFFPGLLFGVLRLRTGSILAGTLFHATCNLAMETLRRSLG